MFDWKSVLRGINPTASAEERTAEQQEALRLERAHRLQYRDHRVPARRAANKRARLQRRVNRRRS